MPLISNWSMMPAWHQLVSIRTCRRVRNSKKIATIRDFHLPGSFLCLSTRLYWQVKCWTSTLLLTLKWPRYFYSRWCPRKENHFPTGILQWNLRHICTGYKKSQFCKKKKKKIENVVPFQNGGQITDFYFTSVRFWPKFEKPLSQRNFSMKFGSK